MGKIIQLDSVLSNKIAAGEVVERPASVVKELVENSIDAHSTIIEIEIEEGGLGKIRVIDNGDGIEEEDVMMAFQRHATSKIKDDNDLFRIRTLGFRGEALPSIASVAKIDMKTSTGDVGTRIVVQGGEVLKMEKSSSRKGTDVTVTDLFFNTPARLKYLKTIHTELGNISDIVNRLALSHPGISFHLKHNGRTILHTNGKGDVRQVLASIYGMNTVKKMIPIFAESLDFEISGWISLPEVTRASRNYISTMVNGRFIKNYPLVKAILEGYHTLLPIGRYPIALIHIQMDPILVDVNVHPAKMEVRFSKEQELNQLVSETIKNNLRQEELIPSGFIQPKKERISVEQTFLELDTLPPIQLHSKKREEKKLGETRATNKLPEEVKERLVENFAVCSDELNGMKKKSDFHEEKNVQPLKETPPKEDVHSRVPPLYPIGQMHGTYILAQNEKGLYIIDQHAAQERIFYEYFKEKVAKVEKELQELLVPLTFEYTTDEYVKIMEHKEKLAEVGVFIEPFGYNSFIVRNHPQWFPKDEEKEIIEEMMEQLLQMKKVDIQKLRDEAAMMMSCKAAIKANRYLQPDEIQALLDQLRRTTDPFTCPHGRPIMIHYTTYELEKMFKRVM